MEDEPYWGASELVLDQTEALASSLLLSDLPWGRGLAYKLNISQEDPLEEGMATHSNILAWKIP